MEKVREFQKNIYFCFIDYVKVFDCVDHNQLFKIIKEIGILGHFTGLLSNLYAGQEATIRTRHATMDLLKIGKGVCKAVCFHPTYLTYAEYIMQNAGLYVSQAGINFIMRNINKLISL